MLYEVYPVHIHHAHPDRWLTPIQLDRIETMLGQSCAIMYVNTLLPGSIAANHFHKKKTEAFQCIFGTLIIETVHPTTKMVERISLSAEPESTENVCVVVRPGIVHRVVNGTDTRAVLMVFATHNDPTGADSYS